MHKDTAVQYVQQPGRQLARQSVQPVVDGVCGSGTTFAYGMTGDIQPFAYGVAGQAGPSVRDLTGTRTRNLNGTAESVTSGYPPPPVRGAAVQGV